MPDASSPLSPLRHGRFEDMQALFAGTLFVAMALMLFNQAGLLVGGGLGSTGAVTQPASKAATKPTATLRRPRVCKGKNLIRNTPGYLLPKI